ncbi:hypothetical protein CPB84DRAFT_1847526 [Gymnopilus junonius]|uniref:Uncharacterized protein n=1 Tax=Gymnopilus junonius TaxID=109634 RepID=A0A9P5TMS9_GYMJU|nr:hypothetical protein CPB84DRAFT_1847526 [Gymnopilus junonius]
MFTLKQELAFHWSYKSQDVSGNADAMEVDEGEVDSQLKSQNIFNDLPNLVPTSALHDELD